MAGRGVGECGSGGGGGGGAGAGTPEETPATAGGGAGRVQPGGGGPRVQHIVAVSWPGGVGELRISRMKKISGLAFATGLGFGVVGGGPLGKYAHFGFAPEFGANGTIGGACTQLSIISYRVAEGSVRFEKS